MNARGYIGRTADGDNVYVEIKTEETAGTYETTDHRTVTGGVRVSIMGHHFEKGSRRKNWSGGGQCVDTVAAVVKPAPGVAREDVARLVEIWRAWHLNDMRAGCDHVPEPLFESSKGYPQADLVNTPACPASGYRYGHAWLYKQPPADVLADLARIGELLDGTDGMR
jgi:hypothetical protein